MDGFGKKIVSSSVLIVEALVFREACLFIERK